MPNTLSPNRRTYARDTSQDAVDLLQGHLMAPNVGMRGMKSTNESAPSTHRQVVTGNQVGIV